MSMMSVRKSIKNRIIDWCQADAVELAKKRASEDAALSVIDVSISYRILNNISIRKSFMRKKIEDEVFDAVKNVSFELKNGEILGIIGKNGSGKSTLLKCLAGVFAPNSGIVDLHGHSISLMALGVGFKDQLSGRENIILSGMLLGFSEDEIKSRMDEIVEFAELGDFIDKPVRTYSAGMHSKLAFAITAMLETDIMLVDEVLSVGDERFRKKSLAKMKELIADQDRTVVIVSHSIETLREFCDKVLWIHDGETIEYGATNTVLEHYLEYMETEKSAVLEKHKAASEALRAKNEAKKQAEQDAAMSDEDILKRICDVREWYNSQLEETLGLKNVNLRVRELFRLLDIFVGDYAGFTRKGDAAFYKFIDSFNNSCDCLNKIDAVALYQDKKERFDEYNPIEYMEDDCAYTITDLLANIDEGKIRKIIDKKTLEGYTVKAMLFHFKNRIRSQVDIKGSILAYELDGDAKAQADIPYYISYKTSEIDIIESNEEIVAEEKLVTQRRLFFPETFVKSIVTETIANYLDYCEKELVCPFEKLKVVFRDK